MGIYYIIALEICFFTFVYWFVFIKPETRPVIRKNVWGIYEPKRIKKDNGILIRTLKTIMLEPNQFLAHIKNIVLSWV